MITLDVLHGADIRCDVSREDGVLAAFTQVDILDGLVDNAALLPGRKPPSGRD